MKPQNSRPYSGLLSAHTKLQSIQALRSFPDMLSGEMCWDGRTLGNDTSTYLVTFSPEDISEIESALYKFKGKQLYRAVQPWRYLN